MTRDAILAALVDGPMSFGQLAARIGVDKGGVSRDIKTLEEQHEVIVESPNIRARKLSIRLPLPVEREVMETRDLLDRAERYVAALPVWAQDDNIKMLTAEWQPVLGSLRAQLDFLESVARRLPR